MGMGGGGSGEDMISDINVTPLVDVCLVLVIIFMAVSPFGLQQGIKVLQQKATAAVGKVAESDTIAVKLTQDLRVMVSGKETTLAKLEGVLTGLLAEAKEKMVVITADETNQVEHVVFVMDTAKQAGAERLAIMKTERVPAKKKRGGRR